MHNQYANQGNGLCSAILSVFCIETIQIIHARKTKGTSHYITMVYMYMQSSIECHRHYKWLTAGCTITDVNLINIIINLSKALTNGLFPGWCKGIFGYTIVYQ